MGAKATVLGSWGAASVSDGVPDVWCGVLWDADFVFDGISDTMVWGGAACADNDGSMVCACVEGGVSTGLVDCGALPVWGCVDGVR